jgi:hypothetical protein
MPAHLSPEQGQSEIKETQLLVETPRRHVIFKEAIVTLTQHSHASTSAGSNTGTERNQETLVVERRLQGHINFFQRPSVTLTTPSHRHSSRTAGTERNQETQLLNRTPRGTLFFSEAISSHSHPNAAHAGTSAGVTQGQSDQETPVC